MSRMTRIIAAIAIVAAVVVIIAFAIGAVSLPESDDPRITRESVEETMTTAIRQNVEDQGGTMDALECVEDGDEKHWRCISTARISGQAYALTVGITCDGETGRCISEPGTFAPKP